RQRQPAQGGWKHRIPIGIIVMPWHFSSSPALLVITDAGINEALLLDIPRRRKVFFTRPAITGNQTLSGCSCESAATTTACPAKLGKSDRREPKQKNHHYQHFLVHRVCLPPRPAPPVPTFAPFSVKNWITLSYRSARAASRGVRPSVFAAFTSTPSSTASFTVSSVRASRSERSRSAQAAPPPTPSAASNGVVTSFRCSKRFGPPRPSTTLSA